MADTIKIFGLEIRVGNTPMDLEKVDKLVLKTAKDVRQAKKDWIEYSNTLTSLKGHELILQFMKEFEVKSKSTTISRRAMTAEEKVVARQLKESAKAEEMRVLAEKSRIGSIRQLEAEISRLNILWKSLSKEERTKTASGRAMTAQLTTLRKELRETKSAAGDFSGNIGNYISGIFNKTSAFTVGILGGLSRIKSMLNTVFSPFQDLEYRMAMVKAVSNATNEEFEALKQNARDLGASTEYTATEVAGLQLAYARMGFVPDQIRQITGATLDLATATGEDLARSADVVGTTLRGFNLEAGQAQRVVDVMTKSFNSSSLQLGYFYDAMKYVGPIATAANVSLEETTAMLGVLADRGIRGSQAGTALRRIFTEIAKEGGSVTERLAQLSKQGLTLGGAMDEVGRYAMTALTVLAGSQDSVDGLTASLYNAGGAAKVAADGIRDTMKGDVDIFLSAVAEKLIAIGEMLAPLGRSIIQTGTWAVTNIKSVGTALLTLIGIVKLASLAKTAYYAVVNMTYGSTIAFGRAVLAETAATGSATAATKAYTAVKLLFAASVNKAKVAVIGFGRALAANPWGLIIAGVAAIISYMVAFSDKTDAATRAQRKFNDENDRFNKAQEEKRNRIEQLIRTIQDETETEQAKIRAYEELQRLSPALTERYSREQLATLELAKSTKILNEERDKETYDNQKTKLDRLVEVYRQLADAHGDWSKANITDEERRQYNGQTTDQALADVQKDIDIVRSAVGEIERVRQQAEENAKPIKVRIEAAENIVQQAENAFKEAETAYKQKRDEWIQEHGTDRTLPFYFKYDMLQSEQNWQDAQKKLSDLKKQEKTGATGGGSEKEKGEWSLSKDKEYNRQLLDLKKKLHSSEISSEEQYQKQVLQLEIDTLTKRIALNKDEAKTILKLKNELWDKQNQQRKNEQKETEAYTANRKAQTEKELKYENDRIDAEIAAMKEGVEKKIRLNDQTTKKAAETAAKEYQTEIDRLNKEQKAYEVGSARYKEIEAEKLNLAFAHELKLDDIKAASTDARTKILREATAAELAEYGKLPDKAAEAERQITENKRREVDERLKISAQELAGANDKYRLNENVADAEFGDDPKDKKRHAARLKNEIELRREQAQTYLADLEWMQKNGQEETAQYNQTLANLARVKQEVENLGRGLNADGSGGGFKGWLMRTFEITPEEVEQLKQQAFDLAQQLSDAIFDAKQQASQRQLNAEKKRIDAEYKTEAKLLDSKRDKGLISEKQYQKELEKLEEKKAKKEEEAERAAFERQKKLNIQQAIMNTAISIAKTFAEWGWPLGIPFAALAAAQGAIQIATIASQKYAQGGVIPLGDGMGVVKGRSHAQGGHRIYLDGTPIGEVEGDELLAIVNKRDTARIGALSAANSVHGRRFAQGGIMSPSGYMMSSVSGPVSFYQTSTQPSDAGQGNLVDTMNLLWEDIKATNERIDRLRVYLVASDVTDAQNDLKKIKAKQSF